MSRKKLNVIGLFSGNRCWERPFIEAGHRVFTTDLDPSFHVTVAADVRKITPKIIRHFIGRDIDVLTMSPPCTTFSIASCGHHWHPPEANGDRKPKTKEAADALKILDHCLELVAQIKPRFWIMENPRGLMRKMPQVQGLKRVTVWYCQYGDTRAKPTDLWGVWPEGFTPRPQCKNGNPHCHHQSAPRGAKTGTQGLPKNMRSLIPDELCDDWFKAVEEAKE